MQIDNGLLKSEERAVFALRELYSRYGYTPYKMSKFEEYDLYVRNKDFLVSDGILSFTDTDGKLMALKPDVTLSIIKNTRDAGDSVRKVYYNENVYRVSSSSGGYKEIMQTGLECIGRVDVYDVYEVVMLAAESLRRIAKDCVLDISHLGILSAVLDEMTLSPEDRRRVLHTIGEKNVHDMTAVCTAAGVRPEQTALLRRLTSVSGDLCAVLRTLKPLLWDTAARAAFEQLEAIATLLSESEYASMVRIDFSVVNDMKYYSGIVFKGFISGVPTGVLSGGQYDGLMKKMGRTSSALGFAVYLDSLERMEEAEQPYEVDTVVWYDDTVSLPLLCRTVKRLAETGVSVSACRTLPPKGSYRRLVRIEGNEVTDDE